MSQHLTKSMGKQLNDQKGTLEDSFVTTEVFPQDASINSGGLVDFKVALNGLGEIVFCAHEPQSLVVEVVRILANKHGNIPYLAPFGRWQEFRSHNGQGAYLTQRAQLPFAPTLARLCQGVAEVDVNGK